MKNLNKKLLLISGIAIATPVILSTSCANKPQPEPEDPTKSIITLTQTSTSTLDYKQNYVTFKANRLINSNTDKVSVKFQNKTPDIEEMYHHAYLSIRDCTFTGETITVTFATSIYQMVSMKWTFDLVFTIEFNDGKTEDYKKQEFKSFLYTYG